jgi:hypothetical protein
MTVVEYEGERIGRVAHFRAMSSTLLRRKEAGAPRERVRKDSGLELARTAGLEPTSPHWKCGALQSCVRKEHTK